MHKKESSLPSRVAARVVRCQAKDKIKYKGPHIKITAFSLLSSIIILGGSSKVLWVVQHPPEHPSPRGLGG